MRLFATAALLAGFIAAPASAQDLESRVHNTGTVALRVFNNGLFGADAGTPTDTTFRVGTFGATLYEGQLVVALSADQVSGTPYSNAAPALAGFDWTFGPRPAVIAATPPFTEAFETTYTDGGFNNTDPAGLTVTQRSFIRPGDDFGTVEFSVSSIVAQPGMYIGLFGDYDISTAATADRGGFDQATRTVYAFNASPGTAGNRNYYGISVIGQTQSGWSASTVTTSAQDLFQAISTNGTVTGDPGTTNADRRLLVGTGPFALAANVPQSVRFAYVTGTNLADLLANAAIAQTLAPVAGEADPAVSEGIALLPAVPNPTSGVAELGFSLDAAQDVRLAVYDVLGREVAVVAEGMRSAGTHRPSFDAQALPAGVYVVRLTAGSETVLRRFTVVR